MSREIAWRVELEVKSGQLASFRELTGEMVEFTRHECGVLGYQRFVSKDGRIVHGDERYADSDAALAHLQNFKQHFALRFLELVNRIRFTVYGTPSESLKELLDELGAIYLSRLGDFDYW